MLADDSIADHELVRRTLSDHCRIDTVTDGVHLLEYCQAVGAADPASTSWPDLILLDINMPRMNGKEVIPKLRSTALGACMPIVIFSSSDHPHDIEHCYKAGCNSYVEKPFELHDYRRALELIAAYWLGLSLSHL